MDIVYLDNNATTQPLPDVVEAMRECLVTDWANPSSVHRPGVNARRRIELARTSIAKLVGCQEREILFCSGGTEAANLAIFGSRRHAVASAPRAGLSSASPATSSSQQSGRRERRTFVTSRLEHSAVRESADAWIARGDEVVWITHRPDGVIDLDRFSELLRSRGDEIAVVSLMWANNETGILQPIDRVGAICREYGVRFHVDATQWIGKMETDVSSMQVDLVSFAAHKFHGPKGIGALYIRRGITLDRQIVGGPQERERRGGTENVPGIVGMGVAADGAREWLATPARAHLAAERDRLERGLRERCTDVTIHGADTPRLWNTTNVGFAKLEAEAILLLLSERGLCASAGAACSSGSLDPSPVLLAMGIPAAIAHGSIRLSLSRFTTTGEIDRALELVPAAIEKLRRGTAALT